MKQHPRHVAVCAIVAVVFSCAPVDDDLEEVGWSEDELNASMPEAPVYNNDVVPVRGNTWTRSHILNTRSTTVDKRLSFDVNANLAQITPARPEAYSAPLHLQVQQPKVGPTVNMPGTDLYSGEGTMFHGAICDAAEQHNPYVCDGTF